MVIIQLEIMSRAIGSFLILIIAAQQAYCQEEILKRLEKLEKAKEDLETQIRILKKTNVEMVTVRHIL